MNDVKFVEIKESDLNEIADIYNYYIKNTTATFHTDKLKKEDLKEFVFIKDKKYKSYLIKKNNNTCGYCLLTQYKNRQAYNRTAEITIYLKPDYIGKGIGVAAIKHLENIAKKNGIKILLGFTTGNNKNSIKLFKKMKFIKCAKFKQVGEKFGKILDVVGYQKILK